MFYATLEKNGVEIASKFPYKVGIVVFMVFPELLKSDEGAAEKTKMLVDDKFFDLLELSWISDSEWSKLKEYVEKTNRRIDFSMGLQPEILVRKYNPSAVNEEERKKAEEVLVRGVEVAGKRGMKAVALCSGPNIDGADREKARKAFIKTVSAMAEKALGYNLPIFVETFDYQWDKKRLLGPIDFSAKVVEEIRASYKNVYLMWDLSHGPLLDEKPEDLKSYADLLGHIHIGCTKKVNDKLYDWHPGFYRPGALNTEKDVAKLLEVLHDINYRGAVSFEVKPEEGQHPLEVVNAAKGVLIRAYEIFLESRL